MLTNQAKLWRMRYKYRRPLIYPMTLKLILTLPELRFDPSVVAPIDESDLIYESICLPPYYGPQDHNDVTPLLTIIQLLQPKLVVEFGTAHGNTVANICRFSSASVVTINALPEQISGHDTTFALTRDDIGYVYRKHGNVNRVTQIYENTLSIDLSQYVSKDSVDVAIVDACHDTEYVINDFCKAIPYLRQGGIVLLHDTHPSMSNHLVGSYVGCMKLRLAGFNICHIENTWWGIWINGGLEHSPLFPMLSYHSKMPIWNYISQVK